MFQTTNNLVIWCKYFTVCCPKKNNADVKWSILMPLISIIIRNKSIWRFENVKNLYWFITSLLYYLLLSLIPCKRKQNQFKSWKSLSSEYREIVRCGHTPKWLKTISRGENDQNYHEFGQDFRKRLRSWILVIFTRSANQNDCVLLFSDIYRSL